MKILIVEDDESNRLLTSLELSEERNWHIISASDGKDAMILFEKEDPDIVTLDIQLPDIEGSKLLRKMKKIRPDVPIIILTGYDKHPDVSEADAYIVKTLSCGADLKKAIRTLDRSSQVKKQHTEKRFSI